MSQYDVPKGTLITEVAEELKKLPACKAPSWAPFAKTGAHKERPPVKSDWWHLRLAAVLRRVAERGPVGVSKLRNLFGGKRNRGFAPERTYPGSGNIIRKALQQLEKSGLVKHVTIGVHKGRKITPQGTKLLDNISKTIMQRMGVAMPKKVVQAPVTEKPAEPKKAPRKRAAPRKKKTEQKTEPPAEQPAATP